jgi:antitoxin HicB
MFYPARLAWDEEGKAYCVTFRDIPEAITQGATEEEALFMAADALLLAMDFYFEDRRRVPPPSVAQEGECVVALPMSAWVKVLLLNEMIDKSISNSDLARRLHTRPQEVQRIVDLGHTTKIDTLAKAFSALGKKLEVRAV